MIITYLRDMINDHKASKKLKVYLSDKVFDYETQYGEWKTQLTMSIIFISSNNFDEDCKMHSKSDNIEIIMGSETNYIIQELCESLLQKYQEG